MDLVHCLHWLHLEPTHIDFSISELMFLSADLICWVSLLCLCLVSREKLLLLLRLLLVVGFQVEKVTAVGQSKSGNVWI
jgi:hypothetical protein